MTEHRDKVFKQAKYILDNWDKKSLQELEEETKLKRSRIMQISTQLRKNGIKLSHKSGIPIWSEISTLLKNKK